MYMYACSQEKWFHDEAYRQNLHSLNSNALLSTKVCADLWRKCAVTNAELIQDDFLEFCK